MDPGAGPPANTSVYTRSGAMTGPREGANRSTIHENMLPRRPVRIATAEGFPDEGAGDGGSGADFGSAKEGNLEAGMTVVVPGARTTRPTTAICFGKNQRRRSSRSVRRRATALGTIRATAGATGAGTREGPCAADLGTGITGGGGGLTGITNGVAVVVGLGRTTAEGTRDNGCIAGTLATCWTTTVGGCMAGALEAAGAMGIAGAAGTTGFGWSGGALTSWDGSKAALPFCHTNCVGL